MKARKISLNRLVPNSQRLQRGDETLLYKLRQYIDASGCYEPLVVRPHPGQNGKFEIIDGHSRALVLKALGYRSALCVIWPLDDAGMELALATLNTLSGAEIPERRAVLLAHLLSRTGEEILAELLPDSKRRLATFARLAKLSQRPSRLERRDRVNRPYVITSFKIDKKSAAQVNLALDLIARAKGVSHSEGIVEMAASYLSSCAPQDRRSATRKPVWLAS